MPLETPRTLNVQLLANKNLVVSAALFLFSSLKFITNFHTTSMEYLHHKLFVGVAVLGLPHGCLRNALLFWFATLSNVCFGVATVFLSACRTYLHVEFGWVWSMLEKAKNYQPKRRGKQERLSER
ncbi:MAG: hypothetical protein NWE98_00310 [Candidatus Bathyarchaeota archaeon]|nr:hypothetical protein [Candidatus Bathyarchaeota archaeon]